jgi:transposase
VTDGIPGDLIECGVWHSSLAEIATTNTMLYRAYLLKDQLREVFRVKVRQRRQVLAGWLP